jgi:DNA/RNA-binding domain of Phe-tRNA-synthetase-like protein
MSKHQPSIDSLRALIEPARLLTEEQLEEQEEIEAWRRHRERQRRPIVPQYSASDEALIRQCMREFGFTRAQAIVELKDFGCL